jgi:hypothetical protein
MNLNSISTALLALILSGCASPDPAGTERGPQGTIAYNVPVESSEPGAKIEVNYQFVGATPTTIKIFGDRDGTFHNFGSDEFIVRAYPPRASQYPQTKIFKTGAFSIRDDKIPQKIFFDFGPADEKPK